MLDDYVPRELFDETVKRYEVMLDRERAKYEKHAAKLEFLVKMLRGEISSLKGEIAGIKARFLDSKDDTGRLMAVLGVCLTAATLFITGVSLYVAVLAPALPK